MLVTIFDMVKCFECGVYFFPGDPTPHKCKSKAPPPVEDLSVVLSTLTEILKRQRKEGK